MLKNHTLYSFREGVGPKLDTLQCFAPKDHQNASFLFRLYDKVIVHNCGDAQKSTPCIHLEGGSRQKWIRCEPKCIIFLPLYYKVIVALRHQMWSCACVQCIEGPLIYKVRQEVSVAEPACLPEERIRIGTEGGLDLGVGRHPLPI